MVRHNRATKFDRGHVCCTTAVCSCVHQDHPNIPRHFFFEHNIPRHSFLSSRQYIHSASAGANQTPAGAPRPESLPPRSHAPSPATDTAPPTSLSRGPLPSSSAPLLPHPDPAIPHSLSLPKLIEPRADQLVRTRTGFQN
jgi:hypothetical protein